MKIENILVHFPTLPNNQTVSNDFLSNWDPDSEPIDVIIGDLGFAKRLSEHEVSQSYCGTPLNMAP